MILYERGIVLEESESSSDERVNVRSGPGTNHQVVAQLGIGEIFLVTDGPECSLLYTWYKIQQGDIDGWIAEGDVEAYFVEPYMPS
jgi:uncharacterized protein YraI